MTTEESKVSTGELSQVEERDAKSDGKPEPLPKGLVFRETVESLAIAFILALLFKAFIAEAFVIPTGSMAPTLMGAHKDVACSSCGYRYQANASFEFDDVGGRNPDNTVVGTVCPLCRKPQVANPLVDANQATFSGDRILVSKLAYVWNQPRRWDVIVFKYIEKARQNYIKRCIGLPNETVRVKEGDIYTRDDQQSEKQFTIARKPPHVIQSMLQIVNDTQFIPKPLVEAGMPSYWQSQTASEDPWQVEWTSSRWHAESKNELAEPRWLRYYHRVVDSVTWSEIETNKSFPVQPEARVPRLITDFTAYNSVYTGGEMPNSEQPERFAESARQRVLYSMPSSHGGYDGIHWTGDLAAEFELETTADSKQLSLLLVESGAKHVVDIDLQTGELEASVTFEGSELSVFEGSDGPSTRAKGISSVRGGRKHTLKMANVDDQIVLWVDGAPVKWAPSNRLDWSGANYDGHRGPYSNSEDPLDGAPVGVSVQQGTVKIHRAKVFRDIYYIAHPRGIRDLYDYPNYSEELRKSVSNAQLETYVQSHWQSTYQSLQNRISADSIKRDILALDPQAWGASGLTHSRRTFDYPMKADWYFPMGDNSAASSDARSWRENHAPRRLMIGRAVVVFFPHWWNAPIPCFPNFSRMGLIR